MWREITEADVLTSLTGPEADALRVAALKAGQDDPMTEILGTAVQEARGYIAGCKTNTLAAGDTLPDATIHHVVAIVRYRMMSRLGMKVSEGRGQEYKDARSFLRDVSACRVGIEAPDGGSESDTSFPSATPTVKSRSRRFSRPHQDGI